MPRHKVLLINLPGPAGVTVNREGACGLGDKQVGAKGFLYPPHTLAALAGQLRRLGHSVKVFDGMAGGYDNAVVIREIRSCAPDVVGIHLSHPALNWDMASTNFVISGLKKTRSIVFGPVTRFEAALIRENISADAMLVGEPEVLFPTVLDAVSPRPGHELTATYCAEEEIESAVDDDGFLEDLDGLAFPAWDLCGIKDGRVSAMASRGCDDSCTYCPYVAAQGRRFRARSPESVAEELAWVVRKLGAKRVIFRDPAFAAQRQRVVEICELILRRGLKFVWECESRPEHFDPGLLGLMRRAGCDEVKTGLETVDMGLLNKTGRIDGKKDGPAYLAHFRQLVEASKTIDLRLRVFTLYGLPGQSQESVGETADFVESLRPSAFNAKAFYRYPGLRLANGSIASMIDGARLLQLRENIEGHSSARGEKRGMSHGFARLKRAA